MAERIETIDKVLWQFATVRQLEYLEAVEKHGGYRAAAKAMGVNYSMIPQAVAAVKKKAMAKGYSPDHHLIHPPAPGFRAKGHSQLFRRGEAEPLLTWVKTREDEEAQERMLREAVAALCSDIKGMAPITKAPRKVLGDLVSVYPLGDPHFGMYSWAAETGSNFDLPIARRLTLAAVDRLVEASPASETAIILPLGDVFHMNDQTNATPGHKHQLDADGRFVKVLNVGIQTFRHAILRALEKHARVVVRFVGGNHDPQAVWALAYAVSAFFESDPRVEVDLSPALHWYFRFGYVLLGATHGDKSKHAQLLGVMAVDRAKDWGETRHRYFYTGHVHNQIVTELPGLTCESFRTLAAADAFSVGFGYRAGRDMRLIVHHREHGEIERHRADIGMLEEEAPA